ncbi:hypothetical protein [Belnapia rosea]|uniref:Uncharacterized protein n=1 Tax=Belnapia rosea TaxID=938405 RepID=A0A1G6LHY7_9PROT|nr:hypothetical protein [Belnapia rosea]SDB47763.1 hypothetical protein SAMN02927895_01799 [Belnapia rosea]SDC42794.1 hypothetical protein SAMN04487779_1001901 [Belnapia rosea]
MSPSIRVAEAPNGALTYAVPLPPERLPAVAPRQLLAAWDLAREAADRQQWGKPRRLLFARTGGEPMELAIADRDAAAWAEAIDSAIGLDTIGGLSLCLRLLALVEVLGRAPWMTALFAVTPAGIDLHPALLSAAAAMPLDGGARFDETGLRRLLSRPLPAGGDPSPGRIA